MMNELYEFAKTVDVIAVFFILYGIVLGLISYGLSELLQWFGKKWDSFWKKHFRKDKETKS